MKTALVMGCGGLIGAQMTRFLLAKGWEVVGIDNGARAVFFGEAGSVRREQASLDALPNFQHWDLSICDTGTLMTVAKDHHFDLIVHAAGQPSHDYSAAYPAQDFTINATGTLNVLEAFRAFSPDAAFVYLSTNKVYGDRPNDERISEEGLRYEYQSLDRFKHGIDETCSVDACLHSPFGVSKLAGDLLTQEYGRYYGLKTGVFRCGCLTGPGHAGVELHGFLNYLVRQTVCEGPYTVYGYGGKQVRDQLHAEDVATAIWEFAQNPRGGAVYNLGGGYDNSLSILEAVEALAKISGKRPNLTFADEPRKGDHICYYSDTRRFCKDYPNWKIARPVLSILVEMVVALSVQ